jgi:hypothetical protein
VIIAEGSILCWSFSHSFAAHSSHIVVDTFNDAAPHIARVSFSPKLVSDEQNVYGPGDVVEMIVKFTQEVTLFP